MPLMKYKLGKLIRQSSRRNRENKFSNVVGISTQKVFIETKANLEGVKLTNYRIVKPNQFAYVADTSRRGDKISLAFNMSNETLLVSSISIVFEISRLDLILPEYLYIYFNRSEFDRYSRYNSWGSAREAFTWDDMCDIEIELPSIEIQQKYVKIYNAMLENQKVYEAGLDDLKLVCDVYIEELRRKHKSEPIGEYIEEVNRRNDDLRIKLAQGIDVNMEFISPKRVALNMRGGKLVRHGEFAFNKVMKSGGTKLPIALRDGDECFISGSYQVFRINNDEKLNPEYLMLWLSRPETQRYAGYISWGSTRDILTFENLRDLEFPIPDIKLQKSIASLYKVYKERKSISEKLKEQIKDICPILIKGSIEEARK